jgi:hypothetical protein
LSYLLTDMPVRCSAVSTAATCTASSSSSRVNAQDLIASCMAWGYTRSCDVSACSALCNNAGHPDACTVKSRLITTDCINTNCMCCHAYGPEALAMLPASQTLTKVEQHWKVLHWLHVHPTLPPPAACAAMPLGCLADCQSNIDHDTSQPASPPC